jgi:hypothetical protein
MDGWTVIVDWTDGHLSRAALDAQADEVLAKAGVRLDALDAQADMRIDVARTSDGGGSMRLAVRSAALEVPAPPDR